MGLVPFNVCFFSVTTLGSAPAALELLNSEKYDAVISDYLMPGMNGIEFLIEVRKTFGKIPFILFTGKGREEVVIQAINSELTFTFRKEASLTHSLPDSRIKLCRPPPEKERRKHCGLERKSGMS